MGWDEIHITLNFKFHSLFQCNVFFIYFKILTPLMTKLRLLMLCFLHLTNISNELGYKGEKYMKVKACLVTTIN
jgi:hypothetical protein